MSSVSFYSLFLILTVISHWCLPHEVAGDDDDTVIRTEREALEIIIGGGGYSPAPSPGGEECPPPPPEPICPPPPSPPPPPPPPSPPPPPPPPSPPPPPPRHSPPPPRPRFVSKNVRRDYYTIQTFKKLIQRFKENGKFKYDRQGITKTWNGVDVCHKYKGFSCANLPDQQKQVAVAAADFNGYSLGGGEVPLTGFLEKLQDLAIFHANSNNFTGCLSKDIGINNIRFFYELDLSNNKYTGGFPKEVLGATNLTFLDLRFNEFSGPVPPEVFRLDLDVLFLNNNQFTQELPDNLGNPSFLYLTFANNYFTGPIPSSIGKASKLLEVVFLNNQFSGCLPYEIGFLRNLTLFDVSQNKLTGPIPHSFGCLAKMQILNLTENEFYGPVPEMVCQLPNLDTLSLSNNYFTEVGPECRKLIRRKVLDVRNNCILDLPGQKSAAACKEFFFKHIKCPNELSLAHIPCKHSGYSKSTETPADQQSMVAAPPPRTYDALIPRNK